MGLGLLIAQVNHGPGGAMVVVHVVAIVALGALAFVLLRGARKGSEGDERRISDHDPERDGRPEE